MNSNSYHRLFNICTYTAFSNYDLYSARLHALLHVVLQYIAVLFLMLKHIYTMAITLSDRYRRLWIVFLYQLTAHNV